MPNNALLSAAATDAWFTLIVLIARIVFILVSGCLKTAENEFHPLLDQSTRCSVVGKRSFATSDLENDCDTGCTDPSEEVKERDVGNANSVENI